ncbi:MAG: DUF4203 domain-containing protein [Verrucomicrobiae bacterium]|nr:DUF4203 domain-containing protein [Verrucomicrobiae bacterium]
MMPISLVLGGAMLVLGRRLFWVFVVGTGFILGARLATELLGESAGWGWLAAVLGAGLLGALLALLAQKVAVAVAGFLAGGYLAHALVLHYRWDEAPPWVAFVVGGAVGSFLLMVLFDWALIAISSLTGAAVITEQIPVEPPWPVAVFLGLLVLGLAVQARGMRRRPAPPRGER